MVINVRAPCDEVVIRSWSAAAPCVKSTGRWVLAATILGSSITFIGGTVVDFVLPVLQREFGASATDAQWVVESYSLMLAALLLGGDSQGDRYGRRRVFAAGIALFTLGPQGRRADGRKVGSSAMGGQVRSSEVSGTREQRCSKDASRRALFLKQDSILAARDVQPAHNFSIEDQ
ncbi:MAG: MFS transporter [Pyrinomonadaceae bacterium]|nr:MFS transporter [Pyrinomonadaceae bacterium]